jgi:hypothetical protein
LSHIHTTINEDDPAVGPGAENFYRVEFDDNDSPSSEHTPSSSNEDEKEKEEGRGFVKKKYRATKMSHTIDSEEGNLGIQIGSEVGGDCAGSEMSDITFGEEFGQSADDADDAGGSGSDGDEKENDEDIVVA